MAKARSRGKSKQESVTNKQDLMLQTGANPHALSTTPTPLTSAMRDNHSEHTAEPSGSVPLEPSPAIDVSHERRASLGSNIQTNIDENLERVFDFTADIIDKQYRSYVWNDGKVQALVTIDTALIAGILLILQVFNHVSLLSLGLLAVSFVFLLISFLICLKHAIPKVNSGIGNEDNLRTMVGIAQFGKEEYHQQVTSLNLGDMVRMNCSQIAGMCKNNLGSHSLIRRGVILTTAGVIAIGIALPMIVFSDWSRRNAPSTPPQSITTSVSPAKPSQSSGVQPAAQAPAMVPPPAKTSAKQSHSQQKAVPVTK